MIFVQEENVTFYLTCLHPVSHSQGLVLIPDSGCDDGAKTTRLKMSP